MSYFNPKYVKELNGSDFEGAKLKKEGYAVVFFYATYCGFCTKSKPDYEEFSKTAAFIKVYCMDGPENVQVKECINIEYGTLIQGWPTIIFFKDGKPVFVVPPNGESRKANKLLETAMKITSGETPS
jgi:thiol-disulfide isomerase/thioredoxin